jgi:hypothetical protein
VSSVSRSMIDSLRARGVRTPGSAVPGMAGEDSSVSERSWWVVRLWTVTRTSLSRLRFCRPDFPAHLGAAYRYSRGLGGTAEGVFALGRKHVEGGSQIASRDARIPPAGGPVHNFQTETYGGRVLNPWSVFPLPPGGKWRAQAFFGISTGGGSRSVDPELRRPPGSSLRKKTGFSKAGSSPGEASELLLRQPGGFEGSL